MKRPHGSVRVMLRRASIHHHALQYVDSDDTSLYSVFDRPGLIAPGAINDVIGPITAILLKKGITVIGQF